MLKGLGITRVMIAHRQETIAMADRVINLAEIQMARYKAMAAAEEEAAI